MTVAKSYRGPEWVEPTDIDLEYYISAGRALQREAMREVFYSLYSVVKEKLNVLRRGLFRATHVNSAS